MTFRLKNLKDNTVSFIRRAGYMPLGYTPQRELNCVRRLGGDYPRFHLYIKEEGSVRVMSLHLDQKKPSYAGSAAHGGDYESETVRAEAVRIRILAGSN